jgi:cytochrome c oxidase cbb3-type subunit 3
MSSPCRSKALAALAIGLALAACQRETRDFHPPKSPPASSPGVSPGDLMAGGGPPPAQDPRVSIYEDNAFHIGEGKRLYDWYNCYSCHAAGGGDIGPPLMDDKWRYGGRLDQIHASIIEGRPNGMPSFRNVLTDEQAWQLAAYVRSLGGNVPKDAAPSRGDEQNPGEPLTQVDSQKPKGVAPRQEPGR